MEPKKWICRLYFYNFKGKHKINKLLISNGNVMYGDFGINRISPDDRTIQQFINDGWK